MRLGNLIRDQLCMFYPSLSGVKLLFMASFLLLRPWRRLFCSSSFTYTLNLCGCPRYLFGDVQVRWADTYFPFTDPSYELEIFFNGEEGESGGGCLWCLLFLMRTARPLVWLLRGNAQGCKHRGICRARGTECGRPCKGALPCPSSVGPVFAVLASTTQGSPVHPANVYFVTPSPVPCLDGLTYEALTCSHPNAQVNGWRCWAVASCSRRS